MIFRDCYTDTNQCLICPEIDAVTAIAPQQITSPNIGWNSGARSIDTLDGNLHVAFTMNGTENGVILGFQRAPEIRPPVSPAFITHGWYFFNLRGSYAALYESGAQFGDPVAYDEADLFEVRRVNGVVTYAINGVVKATSARRLYGPLRAMTCLYAAGDSAPGGTGISGGSGVDTAVNGDNGAITSGEQITVTTPDNPDYANDAYWTIEVPSGASSLSAVVVDNDNGQFIADGGAVGLQDPDGTLHGDALTSVTITSPMAGTWRVILDVPTSVAGIKLTATVT